MYRVLLLALLMSGPGNSDIHGMCSKEVLVAKLIVLPAGPRWA